MNGAATQVASRQFDEDFQASGPHPGSSKGEIYLVAIGHRREIYRDKA